MPAFPCTDWGQFPRIGVSSNITTSNQAKYCNVRTDPKKHGKRRVIPPAELPQEWRKKIMLLSMTQWMQDLRMVS